MPLLKLETTVLPGDVKALLASLSKIVAETIGKPEDYVMITINAGTISMSGKTGEAAFVDIRSIGGLSGEVNGNLSQKVCTLLHDVLGVPTNRIFLNFTDVPASNWGWQGKTFAG